MCNETCPCLIHFHEIKKINVAVSRKSKQTVILASKLEHFTQTKLVRCVAFTVDIVTEKLYWCHYVQLDVFTQFKTYINICSNLISALASYNIALLLTAKKKDARKPQ